MLDEILGKELADVVGEYLPIEDILALKLQLSQSTLKHKRKLLKPTPEMWMSFPETEPEKSLLTESMTADVMLYGVPDTIADNLTYIIYYPPVLAKTILQQLKPLTVKDLIPLLHEYTQIVTEDHVKVIHWLGKYILRHKITEAYGALAVVAARYYLDTLLPRVLQRKPEFTVVDLFNVHEYTYKLPDFIALTNPTPILVKDLCTDMYSPEIVEAFFEDPRMQTDSYKRELFEAFLSACTEREYFERLVDFYTSQELRELISEHLEPQYEDGLIDLNDAADEKLNRTTRKQLSIAAKKVGLHRAANALMSTA